MHDSTPLHQRMMIGALVLISAFAVQAAPVDYSGAFLRDDDRFVINFTLTATSPFEAFTTSWAAGGFAPVLTLFGAAGGVQYDVGSSHTCGDGGGGTPDSPLGFCWDANLSTVLGPGDYTLVLTQDGNLANTDALLDGFTQDGNAFYTGHNYLGSGVDNACVNVEGSLRECDWSLSFDVDEPEVNATPEPASVLLAGAALLALRTVRRRSQG